MPLSPLANTVALVKSPSSSTKSRKCEAVTGVAAAASNFISKLYVDEKPVF
ncbi:hypothetical protein D3C72_418680 [compost metagenome]